MSYIKLFSSYSLLFIKQIIILYYGPIRSVSFVLTTSPSVSNSRAISNIQYTTKNNVVYLKLSSTSPTDDHYERQDINPKAVGLYVHIPYCRRRCRYCNFAIVPIGIINPSSSSSSSTTFAENKREEGFLEMDQLYKNAILSELLLVHKSLHQGGGDDDDDDDTTNNSSSHGHGRIPLRSIYFGGGTPSLAPISTIQSILQAIYNQTDSPFYISDWSTVEISIEMDPGTFTLSYVHSLKTMGFNRISLGVQSFHDEILKLLGRTHRYTDILTSIEYITQVGIKNYSIDLISGLPLLSLPLWIETLEIATTQLYPPPTHLSIYDLQVEKGTVFGQWYPQQQQREEEEEEDVVALEVDEKHKVMNPKSNSTSREKVENHDHKPVLPSMDDCAFMYRYTSGYLRSKGYDHYEISSYARSSLPSDDTHYERRKTNRRNSSSSTWRSQHNQIYWETGAEWYALGLGATSFLRGLRYTRPLQMKDYIDWVHELRILQENADSITTLVVHNNKWIPPWMGRKQGNDEFDESLLLDVILTRLRTKEGLELKWVSKLPNGNQKVSAILKGVQLGIDLKMVQLRNDCIRLVDPDGFLFSNELISSIFYEVELVLEKDKVDHDNILLKPAVQ